MADTSPPVWSQAVGPHRWPVLTNDTHHPLRTNTLVDNSWPLRLPMPLRLEFGRVKVGSKHHVDVRPLLQSPCNIRTIITSKDYAELSVSEKLSLVASDLRASYREPDWVRQTAFDFLSTGKLDIKDIASASVSFVEACIQLLDYGVRAAMTRFVDVVLARMTLDLLCLPIIDEERLSVDENDTTTAPRKASTPKRCLPPSIITAKDLEQLFQFNHYPIQYWVRDYCTQLFITPEEHITPQHNDLCKIARRNILGGEADPVDIKEHPHGREESAKWRYIYQIWFEATETTVLGKSIHLFAEKRLQELYEAVMPVTEEDRENHEYV